MSLIDVPPDAATGGACDTAPAVGEEDIRAALARILASEEFASSPRLADFLRYVVETTLAGRADEIKGYTIAVEALGRPPSFDPQSDPIVRVEATRLRRALERYYGSSGAASGVEISVPKGSYVPAFRVRGGPPAPVPAAEAETPVPVAADTARPFRRRRWLVAAALVALFGVGIVASRVQVGIENESNAITVTLGGRASSAALLADRMGLPVLNVEPFEVAGATGPTGDDLHTLEVRLRDAFSRFDFVEVMSPGAAYVARECRGTPPRSVFSLSGLAEGRADGGYTLLARLSDTCSGNIVWSRELDGPRKGADRAGSEQRVVREIAISLMESYATLPARARAQARLDAPDSGFGCIAQAFAVQNRETAAFPGDVRACIERLAARDNGYGLVHSMKAAMLLEDLRASSRVVSPEARSEMLKEAQLGIDMAPASAFAAKVLAEVDFHIGDRDGALAAAERAMALNPLDYDVVATVGTLFIGLGRAEQGEALINFARDNGAHRTDAQDVYLGIAAFLRDDAVAASSALPALEVHRGPEARIASALVLRVLGRPEDERRVVDGLLRDLPGGRTAIEHTIRWLVPARENAQKVLGELESAGLTGSPHADMSSRG
ncbi:MAG: hypothetical protein B7X99_04975 [Rhizobiales bacterium 17-65-6]|nr:MAG: hypothetical protein B7X99_04975 [Rhizobiales bacterium 17-65-6]